MPVASSKGKPTVANRSSGGGGQRDKNDRDQQNTRREVTDKDAVKVGSGNIQRELLPDDAYHVGIISHVEIKENVPGWNGGDPYDKLSIKVSLPDFPDEEGDEDFRAIFGSARLSMHPKSNLYKWVRNIIDAAPQEGAEFRPLDLVGIPCRVLIKTFDTDDGGQAQCISDFKPFTGKLTKAMNDPAELREKLAGEEGSKNRRSKDDDDEEPAKSKKSKGDEDGEESEVAGEVNEADHKAVVAWIKEGGKDLANKLVEETLLTKEEIKAVCVGEELELTHYLTMYLYMRCSKAKLTEKSFEAQQEAIAAQAKALKLKPDNYPTWKGLGCVVAARNEIAEWTDDLEALFEGLGKPAGGKGGKGKGESAGKSSGLDFLD